MQDPVSRLDLNTASRVELMNLPGVGGALANRILAARPFTSVDDLSRVSGMRRSTLDTLRPFITIEGDQAGAPASIAGENEPESQIEAPQPDGPAQEPVVVEPETQAAPVIEPPSESSPMVEAVGEPAIEPEPEAQPLPLAGEQSGGGVPLGLGSEAAAEPSAGLFTEPVIEPVSQQAERNIFSSTPASKSDLFLAAAISSMVSVFLTLVIIIVMLIGLNGGLRYGKASQVSQLGRDVAALEATTGDLESSMAALQGDVDKLNNMGDRLAGVEQDNQQLREDFTAAAAQMSELTTKMDDLSLQVDAVITRTNRFQQFLDGLRDLLGGLNQVEPAPTEVP